MKISPDVIDILDRSTVTGTNLVLPDQLDRPTYTAVNKVLVAAGGRWDRKAKAHVFAQPAEDIVDQLITTGEVVDAKTEFQAFYSPPEVVAAVIAAAGIEPGMLVLEPSAGEGAIVDAAVSAGAEVTAYELRPCPVGYQEVPFGVASEDVPNGYIWHGINFLAQTPPAHSDVRADRVVMNPPFSKQQDIAHVTHALGFVKPGGRLVAVMTPTWQHRQTKQAVAFRELLEQQAWWSVATLPEGSFKASGTNVHTVLLTVDVPA